MMRFFGVLLFIIGIVGVFNLNRATEGVGIIAFACLLGILSIMSKLSERPKSGDK